MRFQDDVVLVTGAAQGLGRAFALRFAAEGAAVGVLDLDLDGAKATLAQVEAAGGVGVACRADVADEDEVAEAVATVVGQLGGVDVLVNNAALHLAHFNQPFGALPRGDVRRLFEVNVIGTVNCTLACASAMQARGGGAVLNLASVAGRSSANAYGVSKLAVRGLTIAFATELAPQGIRVNAVAPTLVTTDGVLGELTPELEARVVDRQLVRRLATTDDVVEAALYLCSDAAGLVTGETLAVSGGWPLFI